MGREPAGAELEHHQGVLIGERRSPEAGIPDLVEGAMGDGCSLTNARELEPEHFEELYKQAI